MYNMRKRGLDEKRSDTSCLEPIGEKAKPSRSGQAAPTPSSAEDDQGAPNKRAGALSAVARPGKVRRMLSQPEGIGLSEQELPGEERRHSRSPQLEKSALEPNQTRGSPGGHQGLEQPVQVGQNAAAAAAGEQHRQQGVPSEEERQVATGAAAPAAVGVQVAEGQVRLGLQQQEERGPTAGRYQPLSRYELQQPFKMVYLSDLRSSNVAYKVVLWVPKQCRDSARAPKLVVVGSR
jgi:hypothetical protein